MFPYYVPAGIGLLVTALSIEALVHSGRYRNRWPWVGALLSALLLWVPGFGLFLVVPHLWPQVNKGASTAYSQLTGWQIAWIFLGIPVGLIAALIFTGIGRRRAEAR